MLQLARLEGAEQRLHDQTDKRIAIARLRDTHTQVH